MAYYEKRRRKRIHMLQDKIGRVVNHHRHHSNHLQPAAAQHLPPLRQQINFILFFQHSYFYIKKVAGPRGRATFQLIYILKISVHDCTILTDRSHN